MNQVTSTKTSAKTYETTHPWLKFRIDLSRVNPKVWIALGEAQSKCQHIAGVPLRPSTAKNLHQVFLIKGVLASAAIEGNTLSEEEVRDRIDGRKKLPESREYLGREIDNILSLSNEMLADLGEGTKKELTPGLIKEFNRRILKGLELEEGVIAGEISNHVVVVGRYRGAPPEDCEYLLERFCQWLNSDDFRPSDGYEIIYGIIKAIVAHLYFVWIHPFGDGNGRTARLTEVKILLEAGIPSPAAHLLSNHYNKTRTEYYRQLDHATRSGGDVLPFIEYAVKGLLDGLKEQIELIKYQQWDVAWINYVHGRFRGLDSPADTRRRKLVLALSREEDPVPLTQIHHVTSELAEAYAKKTNRTIQRDLNALREMDLIERGKKGYEVKKWKILAFLPFPNKLSSETE